MKRKRTVVDIEESEETTSSKKLKSRSKRNEVPDVNIKQNEAVAQENEMQSEVPIIKKRGRKKKVVDIPDVESSLEATSSSTIENPSKKKKKSKSDINQNGDIGESTKISEISSKISKEKKKNGLQNLETSETPSDSETLEEVVKKIDLKNKSLKSIATKAKTKLKGEKETSKPPIRKKQTKKAVQSLGAKIPQNDTKQLSEQNLGIIPTSLDLDGDKVQKTKSQENLLSVESSVPESTKDEIVKKRPKKKVRIDETESLKVKKELADTEPHFSARELPAKIIKSKLNKNLTEEVKVSPLTVQSSKKERKTSKKIKMEKLQIKQDVGENEVSVKEEELEHEDDADETNSQYLGLGLLTPKNDLHDNTSNSEDSDLEVYYINKNAEKEAKKKDKLLLPKKHSILMPKEDQLILVQRVQNVIPEGDTKSYKFRLQKLEWQHVAFKNYSIEYCQNVWGQLLKKVRHYRLLAEITHDIAKVIELNDLKVTKPSKTSTKKHPDMPKRPLTSYFLYYIRERDKVAKEMPDLDTLELNKYISEKYQSLPFEKKQKYEVLAAKNREEYKRQMEEFYDKHPEMRKVIIKKPKKEKKQKPPKKPENPYRLFMQSELSREEIADEDKAEFKEVCREKWRQMSDSKKLGWIKLAEEHLEKYEEELKEYMSMHPEYTPKAQPKPFLSREEMKLKDKLAGKPKKPPGNAYGLFISLTLQSNETANIPPKERWMYTSAKWKAMTEEERDQYKQLLSQVHDQYEKDFKVYLESLPEDKREEEILRNMPKKRKNASADKPSTSGVKTKKAVATKTQSSRRKSITSASKSKPQNPVPPPRSAFKYFAEKYTGENPKEAWKNLNPEDKGKYEQELSALKDKYIKEFESFLKGLSKEELAAFCANRSAQVEYSSSDESASESEHVEEDSSDNSSDSSDSENGSDEN